MIPTTNEYKRQLIAGNRNYVVKANVYLADNETQTPDFVLTNNELWENGVTIDNAISSDNSFDIGAAIIGSLTLVIDNITGNFSQYDFLNAKIVLYMGVTGDVDGNNDQIYYRINYYVVDNATYNGSLITLDCLDNMTWFDVPFSEVTGISYPTTAGYMVAAICSHVGVTLGSVTFPNYNLQIKSAPEKDNNCREILSYIAQKCCCYCKINTAGQLILTWYDKTQIIGLTNYDGGTYDTDTTPYSDGDDVDGGNFFDYTSGDDADGGTFTTLQENAFLTQNYDMNIGTDDIAVTGCRVRKTNGDDAYDELWVDTDFERDHERYVLVVEDNPLIEADEAATVANIIGSTVARLPIRAFTARSLNDISYETGDMVTIMDFRNNIYYSWITSFTFTTGDAEQFACGAESVHKRSETRFSDNAKTLAEAKENASKMLTDYDRAVKSLNELAQDAIGYNQYQRTISGANVTWLYNGHLIDTAVPDSPLFPDSTVVFKISGDGVFISNDGGNTYTQGYDANSGTAILSLIYAIGINCDWIHAGTLTLGGTDNVNGVCSVLDENGDEKVRLDQDGITATKGVFSGRLSAATGTLSDGRNNLMRLSGGNILMASNTQGGAALEVSKAYNGVVASYAKWGAQASQAMYGGHDTEQVLTHDIVMAGKNESDRRLKQDIKDIDSEFAKQLILGVSPKEFRYKNSPDNLLFGVIAQDVKKVTDEFDLGQNRLCYSMDESGMLFVEYRQFIAPMIKVIQDQQTQIDELKQELAELKAR